MKDNEMLWHTMETEAVLAQLSTSSAGLTEEEARTRRTRRLHHRPRPCVRGVAALAAGSQRPPDPGRQPRRGRPGHEADQHQRRPDP